MEVVNSKQCFKNYVIVIDRSSAGTNDRVDRFYRILQQMIGYEFERTDNNKCFEYLDDIIFNYNYNRNHS